MKTYLKTGGAVAVVLAAGLAGMATAQQAPRAGARVDANADGRISRAEFVQARVDRLTRLDGNRDGTVTADEMLAGREARRAERVSRRMERLNAADLDDDGRLSSEEVAARRDERRARRGEAAFQRLDANGDGQVSRAEFDARPMGKRGPGQRMGRGGMGRDGAGRGGVPRGPVTIAQARTAAEAAFTRMDANRDGQLTADERGRRGPGGPRGR